MAEDIHKAVKGLKQTPAYKNWKPQFDDFVLTVSRCSHPLHWFLLYDVRKKSFCIRSEFEATYDQIALREAIIPAAAAAAAKSSEEIIILDL